MLLELFNNVALRKRCSYSELFWFECRKIQTSKAPNTYNLHAILEKNTADAEKNVDSDLLQIAIVFFFFQDNWILSYLQKNELIYRSTYYFSFDV